MKKIIISIVIIVGLGVAVYAFQQGTGGNPSPTVSPSVSVSVSPSVSATPTASPTTSPTVSPTKTATPTAVSTIKTFTVVGKSFSFTPAEMTVNKGDTVKIIFQNSGGSHNWKIDEFNASTKVISSGQTETIQFVADKTGTFEYYCSVGTHRQMGMRGNLIVK